MSGEGKVVCVTGASGYIASWLVMLLLEHGYTVKATVRYPDDPKVKHLHALDGANERLHLFKANLLEEGSFDSAVSGCEGVFHTASPVIISAKDPQAELIDPAVKGTLNVLRSCVKVQSLWYPLSKTLAEEAALRFAKDNGIDLVTLLPGLVIGPMLQSTLNFSVDVIFNIINGTQTHPGPYILVDVRDVAYAHIQVLKVPTASGRYLLVNGLRQFCEVLKILHQHYPTFNLPEKFKDAKYEPTYQISNQRAKSLGIKFMPWEVSLRDTVESFKEKGFLIFQEATESK
ncbi:hypothetical protein Pint_23955 [Pistacia integerrima]|uniref:Uncharacterized protein n=1 Tax=Pistacia integerrima TaxID=434235 RepID=A0ACC0YNL5_9ROSI|nr:hypothetical protein Pint_23955 [Pistacia integerrima]